MTVTKDNLVHKELIDKMTLAEKASLLSGENFWNTKNVERLGIPSIMLTDGPHGLRKQGGKADHLGLNKSIPATCFPTAATLANSWDENLLDEVGACLGQEAKNEKVSVLLGPGLNIKRNPLGGRNFEYFSEDPYLTGKLAAAMTRGIQSQGVSACPKHFAVNSQETRRMIIDEIVDERAFHELYLEGFRHVVKEADPKTIMTSYNKINGIYANENSHLLQDILVKGWGFKGVVVTDWGGNNDRVSGLLAGNTLEMPSAHGMTDAEIVAAVKMGEIPEILLDEQVGKLLTLISSTLGRDGFREQNSGSDVTLDSGDQEREKLHKANHEKAIDAATRSVVLLKNEDDILPIMDLNKKIALIGDFAENPRYQGAGSSLIEPTYLENLHVALKDTDLNIIGYEKGFQRYGQVSKRLLDKALALAKKADMVILSVGLDEGSEAEGVDRKHMRLAENQLVLIEEISKINAQIIVVIAGGSPVEMPFHNMVKSIVHGYLPGQGGGVALARVLLGEYNPSGKLAESYPVTYDQVASSEYYPGGELTSEHRESIFIGYRQYDKMRSEVRYPFGHGLSYTTFTYSDLAVEGNQVTLKVKNTGKRAGEEIVQIYVAPLERRVFHEEKSLKGFKKVFLEPGETRVVSITLDEHAYAYYHVGKKGWVTESGQYTVMAAASSRDIRLQTKVSLEKGNILKETFISIEAPEDPYTGISIKAYRGNDMNLLTSEEFAELLGRKLPEKSWDRSKELTKQDLIEQAKYKGWFGKMLYRTIMMVHHILRWRGRPIDSNNVLFVLGLPFRSLARMSGGKVDMKMLDGLLHMVNGHFFTGLRQYNRAWRNKNKEKTKISGEA